MWIYTEEFTLVNIAHIRLQQVIWVHAFERFEMYMRSKSPQVTNITSYVIIPE